MFLGLQAYRLLRWGWGVWGQSPPWEKMFGNLTPKLSNLVPDKDLIIALQSYSYLKLTISSKRRNLKYFMKKKNRVHSGLHIMFYAILSHQLKDLLQELLLWCYYHNSGSGSHFTKSCSVFAFSAVSLIFLDVTLHSTNSFWSQGDFITSW